MQTESSTETQQQMWSHATICVLDLSHSSWTSGVRVYWLVIQLAFPPPSGQNEDELSCKQADVIKIVESLGDGWLKVRKGNEEGYVPESYVQIQT